MAMTRVKTADEIVAIRESGRMTAAVLQLLKSRLQPGMSTKDLALIAAAEIKAYDVGAPFLGYQGFPDVICISLNDEVVHGIPRADRIVQDGDIVSLDFGVKYNGMITDSALTAIAGKAKQKRHIQLVQRTEQSLTAGIMAVRDRVRAGDIGAAVQAELDKAGYGIVRDLVGHGVGHELHEDPNVPNTGRPGTGPWFEKNMTIAIEPMATLGTEKVYLGADDWTILTYDGSMAAHFEHTVLILEDGAEVLTEI
jgi:methionyl aminopeptidase